MSAYVEQRPIPRPFRSAVRLAIRKRLPTLSFMLQYYRAMRLVNKRFGYPHIAARDRFLAEANQPGNTCLQIGVKESEGAKRGPNWVSVDKFDTRPFIDYNYDITDMAFADNTFDFACAISILEHLPTPWAAIKELHRVLKPGGKIWLSIPMTYPYHEDPKDYWRASPDGMRIWMQDLFNEQTCGVSYWAGSSLCCDTHYIGTKK
jgi:SAM-dependent methyltransferase